MLNTKPKELIGRRSRILALFHGQPEARPALGSRAFLQAQRGADGIEVDLIEDVFNMVSVVRCMGKGKVG
jgi:hypothetical protein